jgi:hypothetical protein
VDWLPLLGFYFGFFPLNFVDPTGHCAEFGDDECWGVYDQIVNFCIGCATPDLWKWGKPFLEEYLESLKRGWHPYYSCTGRADCYTLINTWLAMLMEAGLLGQELVEFFLSGDITVLFVDDVDWEMKTDYFTKTIKINDAYVDKMYRDHDANGNIRLFLSFAHEIVHHQQGFWVGNSIQGEYLAYSAQIELARNWDAGHGRNTAEGLFFKYAPSTFEDWDLLAVDLNPNSYADMKFFYGYFFEPGGYYEGTPILPWPLQLMHNAGNCLGCFVP